MLRLLEGEVSKILNAIKITYDISVIRQFHNYSYFAMS